MRPLTVLLCCLLGLAVGSFLNVVIWRVPRGESVVRPRSRCPECHHAIRARDNIPVVSWIILRGRCRDCRAPVKLRYPIVEGSTGVLFGLLAWHFGPAAALPAFLYLGAISVALASIDLDLHRLPNSLTLPSYVVGGVLLLVASIFDGHPAWLLRAGLGMVALYALYFLLRLGYPRGMGFGDVKLAGVLGMYLGYLGWEVLVTGAFLGFLLGGVVGVGLMLARRASRKSMIPFGPFMLGGALLAVFIGGALTSIYTGVTLH